jgi:hypothetical protein
MPRALLGADYWHFCRSLSDFFFLEDLRLSLIIVILP